MRDIHSLHRILKLISTIVFNCYCNHGSFESISIYHWCWKYGIHSPSFKVARVTVINPAFVAFEIRRQCSDIFQYLWRQQDWWFCIESNIYALTDQRAYNAICSHRERFQNIHSCSSGKWLDWKALLTLFQNASSVFIAQCKVAWRIVQITILGSSPRDHLNNLEIIVRE